MAKFIYRMQNILNIKYKLEESAKQEYAEARQALAAEEQKLDALKKRKQGYYEAYQASIQGRLDFLEIEENANSMDILDMMIEEQNAVIRQKSKELELARQKMAREMQERKMHEKLKEKKFDEFKQELNATEKRETDEVAGYQFTSAKKEENIEKLKQMLKGKTTSIAGPSGVGKSSLINLLQSGVQMETGSISRKIARGKHTTRHSELIMISPDSYIMDTPGFSSLYVNDFEKEELKYYFPEFEPYEGGCKYNGCDHIHEPGCAIKEAVESGKIHEVRYEDYKEMYEELKNKRRY